MQWRPPELAIIGGATVGDVGERGVLFIGKLDENNGLIPKFTLFWCIDIEIWDYYVLTLWPPRNFSAYVVR